MNFEEVCVLLFVMYASISVGLAAISISGGMEGFEYVGVGSSDDFKTMYTEFGDLRPKDDFGNQCNSWMPCKTNQLVNILEFPAYALSVVFSLGAFVLALFFSAGLGWITITGFFASAVSADTGDGIHLMFFGIGFILQIMAIMGFVYFMRKLVKG